MPRAAKAALRQGLLRIAERMASRGGTPSGERKVRELDARLQAAGLRRSNGNSGPCEKMGELIAKQSEVARREVKE